MSPLSSKEGKEECLAMEGALLVGPTEFLEMMSLRSSGNLLEEKRKAESKIEGGGERLNIVGSSGKRLRILMERGSVLP